MFCLQCPFIQVRHRPKYEGQWRTYGDNGVTSWDFGQTLCKLTAMWFQLICSYLNYFCTFPYIYLLLRLFRRFSLGLRAVRPSWSWKVAVYYRNWVLSSDVPAPAWGQKPGQARPKKAGPSRALCLVWGGFWPGLWFLKAQADGLSPGFCSICKPYLNN